MPGCKGKIKSVAIGDTWFYWVECTIHGRESAFSWADAMRQIWPHLLNQHFWYLQNVGHPYEQEMRDAAGERIEAMFRKGGTQ